MNACILCVGKLKEKWQTEGCNEYLKRLSRYGKYEIVQIEDQREPENASPALIKQIIEKEGKVLLSKIKPTDRVVALCVKAQAPDSVKLSELMQKWSLDGRRIVLVIGGSNGLSDEVLARADEKISFSNLTFPHGLMRVVLLEQLYRAERIRTGEKYHK